MSISQNCLLAAFGQQTNVRGKASRRIRKKYEQDRLGGSCYRGRTQFKTNCLGYRKWISLPFFVLTNRLQYSPKRTEHTLTITSKLLQRLGAPRGAGLSWKNCETPPKRIRNNYARTQQSWKFNIWKMWNWKYSKKCAKKLLTGLLWTC